MAVPTPRVRVCWAVATSLAAGDARPMSDRRVTTGKPCSKGYVRLFNTESTPQPICTASREYQVLRLQQLAETDLPEEQRNASCKSLLAKSCICHDLAGGATRKHGIDPAATPAVCCGRNIMNFSHAATLEEMVGHIYGRHSLLNDTRRPHMLLTGLALDIAYRRDERARQRFGLPANSPAYLAEYPKKKLGGIEHYRRLTEQFPAQIRTSFLDELGRLHQTFLATMANPSSAV